MTALPSQPPAAQSGGADRRAARRWGILFVLSGNMILDALEVSVVLVALPTIGAELGLSLFHVQWVMSGFALGFATVLVLGARINARWGRRRAYLAAMVVFAAASVAGGLTDSAALLIATRVVKGACAALTAPTGLAIISTTFKEGAQQRRAVSVYSLFGAAGFTLGLLLSGILLEASWRWTFLFPAPVALVLLVFGLRLIPGDTGRATTPPAGLALLRNGPLLRASLGAAALNGTYHCLLVAVTFAAQSRLGLTPWQTALALLPACVPLAVTVPFAGRFVTRFGTARPIALGALSTCAGCALYTWRPADAPYAVGTLPALLLLGTGLVFAFAALNMQATSTIAPQERPMAVPLYQTAVQLGAIVLLPLTAVLLTRYDGDRPALLLVLAASGLGLFVALTALRGPGAPTSRKVQS
ncbi:MULTISPECIES: MFS transporter [unclassified Streptomyces]|uniref:MFS transporter n=1 Tax=unclassified Streptomyces TaxID=2593676 RepID=UPI00093EBE79|nr:MFS transporter [Streptomyces sp. CB02414]OKI81349.1 arabinose transporter permease [Streptomyces sp. CB02414]